MTEKANRNNSVNNRLLHKSGKLNAHIYENQLWNQFSVNNLIKLTMFNICHIILTVVLISWGFFALVYYIIEHYNDGCTANVKNFVGAIMFSIETQQTIGYGFRASQPEERCVYITAIITIQTIVGLLITTISTGVVMQKFYSASDRIQQLAFSQVGVVTQRNGELCLVIRVADKATNRLIGTQVEAVLYKSVTTKEGEYIDLQPHKVHFGYDLHGGSTDIPTLWPVLISHKIDHKSPFYDVKPPLDKETFELVVWISGTKEENGSLVQMRTSFTQDEIKWGHRFCTKIDTDGEEVIVYCDDASINNNAPDNITTNNSARELDQKKLEDEKLK